MQDRVNGPALGLMFTAGLGALWALVSIGMQLLGIELRLPFIPDEAYNDMDMSGGFFAAFGVLTTLISLLICDLIFYGGMKMRELKNYGLAITASILAMTPCGVGFFCCIPGLPIGIWALVILLKPEVKETFQ